MCVKRKYKLRKLHTPRVEYGSKSTKPRRFPLIMKFIIIINGCWTIIKRPSYSILSTHEAYLIN